MDPVMSTQLGIPGSDAEWGGAFGLEGVTRAQELRSRYRPLLEPFLDSNDQQERLAARVMVADFDQKRAAYDNGDHFRDLRHMASAFHRIRLIFDVMRVDTADARDNIVRRMETIDHPLGDYRRLLEVGLDAGVVVSSRQVRSVIDQSRRMSTDSASIDQIVHKVAAAGGDHARLSTAAKSARAAYAEFGDWLETHYLPKSVDKDGADRDTYLRAAGRLVGLRIDPDEVYAWGWEEVNRLLDEMRRVAGSILPGESVETIKEFLETDPSVTAAGTAELLSFVERTLREAVDELAGLHFEVPEVIRPLTVELGPPGSPLGVYYRRPSEDFSRPGGVWYSVGDQEVFPLYQHVSTAYHEGFPGHHLQSATAMYRSEDVSRFQRLLTWCPGYGEGWGMYAEVLMGELGYLENPHHYFGMLAKQMYRAARVVVDIGLHLDKPIDETSPLYAAERWTFDKAVEFMSVFGFRTAAQAWDEVLRYLGWPGQAIAYKLGEREILRIRSEANARLGRDFDLRSFHSAVIGNGSMRLDLLHDVVMEQLPH